MLRIAAVILLSGLVHGFNIKDNTIDSGLCSLPSRLSLEIESYKSSVDTIIHRILEGDLKGQIWSELAEFIDKFGNRIAGSQNLENAIDYMLERSRNYSLQNVHGEPVEVPRWIRGNEFAELVEPRSKKMNMLGLGGSVSTGPDGITAEALVVENFDELNAKKNKVKGKIVVFVEPWVSYGQTVKYRSKAASVAAKYGAVASLIKSVTPFSIDSPHTGWQSYESGVKKIPTAAITIEDAAMLLRMRNRGEKIVIKLYMEATTNGTAISRNTIGEVTGRSSPDQYVLVSGHLDSWDVGTGAMDDGGGAFISWYVPVVLKKLNLVPRRTVRSVLWTGEEEGLIGAEAYKKSHSEDNIVLAMESDEGTFYSTGLYMSGSKKANCMVQHILKLLGPINATVLEPSTDVGSDIQVWAGTKVPLASLRNNNSNYFWYHHSNGDTMQLETPQFLDRALAIWTTVSYVLADLSVRLPSNSG